MSLAIRARLSESGFSGLAGFSGFHFVYLAIFAITEILSKPHVDKRRENPVNPDSDRLHARNDAGGTPALPEAQAPFSRVAIFQTRPKFVPKSSEFSVDNNPFHAILFLCSRVARCAASPQHLKKEGISVFDWKARAVGDRSCICTGQSRNRDCDDFGNSTRFTPVRGIRAMASRRSPFRGLTTLSSSRIGTRAAVSRSRMSACSDGGGAGRARLRWARFVSPPPPPAASAAKPVL